MINTIELTAESEIASWSREHTQKQMHGLAGTANIVLGSKGASCASAGYWDVARPLEGQIEGMFSINDKKAVFAFLAAHEELKPLLSDTYFALRKFFPAASLVLVLEDDPDEKSAVLVARVKVDRKNASVESRKMSDFDESWWLANACRSDGLFVPMLRYR